MESNGGVSGIMALQTESKFAEAYQNGVGKMDYWQSNLEDCLDLIARIPEVAALIYRCKFHDGVVTNSIAHCVVMDAGRCSRQ